jgi:endoglycosylceramidase
VTNYLTPNEYVIGYDPFNEPMPAWHSLGDFLNKIYPGHYDREQLAPLYTRLFEKYKAASSENIMMFEPGQFPDEIGLGVVDPVFHVGFETPPGGAIGSANHVLNDHTYCCQVGPNICAATGEPAPEDAAKCLAFHTKRIRTRDEDAKRLGIPLIMSEFGACLDTETCATEIQQVADVSDEHLVGWAYWQFKNFEDLTTSAGTGSEGFYNKDGSLQTLKVKALSRTYAQATQGKIVSQTFDSKTGDYTLKFTLDTSNIPSAPTQIHALHTPVHGMSWYPNGVDYDVSLADGTKVEKGHVLVQEADNTTYFLFDTDEFNGQEITIHIKDKVATEII